MVVRWYFWVDCLGCSQFFDLLTFLGLIPCCSDADRTAFERVCRPINIGVEALEPGVSQDHSVSAEAGDIKP